MTLNPQEHSLLLRDLERAARQHPVADKLLVCRPRGVGRELLHALAQAGHGWLGFRVQTPFELATELAATSLAGDGLATIDRFDEIAILDQAIDLVLDSKQGEALRELGESVGFRNALAGSIRELRLAGLDSAEVAGVRLEDITKKNALAAIQRAYEATLHERHLVDRAEVLRRAAAQLADGAPFPAERIYLLPGMPARGRRGAFLQALIEHGAEVLYSDPVIGLERPAALLATADEAAPEGRLSYLHGVASAPPTVPGEDLFTPAATNPTIRIFAAASPVDELREVLRRIMDAGLLWDAVEIVTTDATVYGTALDSIAPLLIGDARNARVTHAAGLPIARTRTGRAVASYLRWVQEDFPETTLRSLLSSGQVRAPGEEQVGSARLARMLEDLRIGWGRDRYLTQIEWRLRTLDGADSARDERYFSDEQMEQRRTHRRAELETLAAMIGSMLEATPPTPDRIGSTAVRCSPAALAGGVLRFLDYVDTPDSPDTEAEAKRRLTDVLQRTAATLHRECGFRSAIAIVERLIDLRVPSPSSHGRVPWSSAGGYLHFSDLEHGGLSGRQHTFVVGLDAGRFPGGGRQDPLLLDGDRARLAPEALPRGGDALAESRYGLALLLARLRGEVTLSYSAWDASEGRRLSPASVLLQAHRLERQDPGADYQSLEDATHPVAGPVPSGSGLIDDVDLWLAKLDDNGLLKQGTGPVRAVYAGLDRGLIARDGRRDAAANEYKGAVAARPQRFDPRLAPPDRLLSASRLEMLASCPLKYFFNYVLGFRSPETFEFATDRWLNAMQRGSLFHDVYEKTLNEARDQGVAADSDELAAIAHAHLEAAIDQMRRSVPTPSEAVFDSERRALRDDLGVFLGMLARSPAAAWLEMEWKFGFAEDSQPAVELQLAGGTAYLRGAVDRIDEDADGKLAIIDYKTGSLYNYGDKTGVYNGGRRLQHALYTHAVEQLIGRPVESASYHFPTRRGSDEPVSYPRAALDRWPIILNELFEMISAGLFLPPFDKDPPCRFCDFGAICRVREGSFGSVYSPPVEWAIKNNVMMAEFAHLQRVRQIDD